MCNKIYNSFSIFLLRRTRKTLVAYTHNAQTDETLEYDVREVGTHQRQCWWDSWQAVPWLHDQSHDEFQ